MFKSILNYIRYRRFIKDNKEELIKEFGVKIDNLYRLGSRISIPESRISVLREYKNSELDIYKSLDAEVKKQIGKLDRYFMQKNVVEYVGISSVERVDQNLVILIISYRLLNVIKLANASRIMYIISLLSLFAGFFGLWFLLPGVGLFLFTILMNTVLFKKLFV